jgi:hypothetical protein
MRIVLVGVSISFVVLALGCSGGTTGGGAGGSGGGNPLNDGGSASKRVFFTSTLHGGDFKTSGGGNDGADGADKLCALAATGATLGGQWKAWVSTSSVDAIDRIADVGPWKNMKGQIAFQTKADLTTGTLMPIEYDEAGLAVGTTAKLVLWTGTGPSGQQAQVLGSDGGLQDGTCLSWTTAVVSSFGSAGWATGSGQNWTAGGGKTSCETRARLICFEQ